MEQANKSVHIATVQALCTFFAHVHFQFMNVRICEAKNVLKW